MRNPFRSEAEAYRLVLILAGFFAVVIAANALLGRWGGLAAFVVLAAALLWWLVTTGPRERPAPIAPSRRSGPNERRILVVANETVGGATLRDLLRSRAEGVDEEILVVCPALNSPVRHWASDEDSARREAQGRLARSLERLREAGINARGEVGDGEPLQAMEDALRTFGADEIVISTHPEGRSHWLERGIVESARQRFAVPITHVTVDLEAEREEVT
ncbi:MAG: universal stress protein [Thermoleophilia bacterium]|nr:universal stress protein [Thermoleophilia bacterium]